jgi:hypothetical protein
VFPPEDVAPDAKHRVCDSHQTPPTAMLPRVQAPLVGAVELKNLPSKLPATHSETDAQDRLVRVIRSSPFLSDLGGNELTVHALASPAGSLEAATEPPSSPATHSIADAHERLWNRKPPPVDNEPSTVRTVQAPGPPVGFVVVKMCPESSTAAQNDADGQDTAVRGCRTSPSGGGSMSGLVQAAASPVGFVETNRRPMPPMPPTATQSETDGQDIPLVKKSSFETVQRVAL